VGGRSGARRDYALRMWRSFLAVAAVMLVLDLSWLGVIAAPLYARAIGHLMAPSANLVGAVVFYLFYVVTTTVWATAAPSVESAAKRGAGLGFVAYATYELTNWAVLRDWPFWLVPVDVAWGVVLTAVSAAVGRWARA
jgi:uncharacterized membrane protein